MDGGLIYGPFRAWTDAIRSFENGELAAQGVDGYTVDHYEEDAIPIDTRNMIPLRNDKALPFANPAPPANESLFPVDRFWSKSVK
jgi:dual oxidase